MKKRLLPALLIILFLAVSFTCFNCSDEPRSSADIYQVRKGTFFVDIITSGELAAKNSVLILGPNRLQDFGIYQMTISRMVDEGTVVRKGDWVADIDRSEFNTKLQDTQLELEKSGSAFLQTQLDTALQMRQSRDDLINLKYGVEQAKLTLDQSQYEPPAIIKQNEINLDKARRSYEQSRGNYKIKTDQNKAKMQEVNADLQKNKKLFASMNQLADQFTITAPEPGMVIYSKSWDNTPIKTGSQIWVWDPTVATLPDMTIMISKTYINEVDVRNVKAGQRVELGLDAFPDKNLAGVVVSVANVGEQRPNSDAKVFEAIIQIKGTDPALRPSMTTSNRIIEQELHQVISVPLEYLHSENDSITYVCKKSGTKIIKQEVTTGPENNSGSMILAGLKEGDRIYISIPDKLEKEPVTYLPGMKGNRVIKKASRKKQPEVKDKQTSGPI